MLPDGPWSTPDIIFELALPLSPRLYQSIQVFPRQLELFGGPQSGLVFLGRHRVSGDFIRHILVVASRKRDVQKPLWTLLMACLLPNEVHRRDIL